MKKKKDIYVFNKSDESPSFRFATINKHLFFFMFHQSFSVFMSFILCKTLLSLIVSRFERIFRCIYLYLKLKVFFF